MNKIWLFASALCMVMAFGSCKPKQSAYKAAYEQAREKSDSGEIYQYVDEANPAMEPISKPRTNTADETTRQEKITAATGEDASMLKRFSVVIGSFTNSDNAYSLKNRMTADGYNAVLGRNERGMLRVIVSSFDSKADAVYSRENIKARYAPQFHDAWILENYY